jgi:hypothetical protein
MPTQVKCVSKYLLFCGLATIFADSSAAQKTYLLSVTPAVAQFPSTAIGTTSSPNFPVSIQNSGSNPVTINSITITGTNVSDFAITSVSCPIAPASLSPGANCGPAISFTPSVRGKRIANLTIVVAGGLTQNAVLVGTGVAAVKALSFNVTDVSFPATAVGVPAQFAPSSYVALTSTGTVPITIQSVGLTDLGNFSIPINYCSGPLSPGATCYSVIVFEPVSVGRHSAKLVVLDDAPAGKQTLPVVGIGTAATKTLQLYPLNFDFGPVALGNPQQLQVILQNNGSESFFVNGEKITGQNASDYSIASNTCSPPPYSLAAGAECSFQIQFTPAALGVRLANVVISDTASGSPHVLPLVGSGVAEKNSFAFIPPLINFGLVPEGQTPYNYPVFVNTGNTTIPSPSISIKGGSTDFQIASQGCTFDLPPEGSCAMQLGFAPTRTGLQTSVLVASETDIGKSVSATMVGSGVSSSTALSAFAPGFSSEPVGVTTTGSATLQNVSSSSITITHTALVGAATADFAILQNGCVPGTVLAAGTWCPVQLAFTPSAVGSRIAALSVRYSGGTAAVEIPLAGIGIRGSRTVAFSPAEVNAGAQQVGSPLTANPSPTIYNSGTEPMQIDHVSIQGPNAADWALTQLNCPLAPATLAAGTGCTVALQFTPKAPGTRVARLEVTDNAAGSPQSLQLAGFGSTSLVPPVSIYPLVVSFDSQPLGSSAQQIQPVNVSNEATYPITVSQIKISGANASDFSLATNCTSSVPALGNCFVSVTFTPSVTGLRSAELLISYGPNGGTTIIPLSGFGVKASASVAITQNPTLFQQAAAIGYTVYASINVANTGSENVTLSKFAIGGIDRHDFGIQNNTCPFSPAPLSPGGNCTITIAFTPTALGVRMASFRLTDSSPGSPHAVSLVGEGVKPVKTLQFYPTSVDFGGSPVGFSAFNALSIYNSGTAPVTFRGFSIAGPNPGDFSITANFCIGYIGYPPSLDPGTSCTVYLYFTPLATGLRSATLEVKSDAVGSPGLIGLTGTGQ